MKSMDKNPVIITCAVTGAELTKKECPYLPISPDEIALSAKDAVLSGAAIIHLHVRDKAGRPSQNTDIFHEVTEKILALTDCIIQFSTGGTVGTPDDLRIKPLLLKPHMATISMGSMNFGDDIYKNSLKTIKKIAGAIRQNNIMPEFEIFDLAMLETAQRLQKAGGFFDKFHINFVLGVKGGTCGSIKNLAYLTDYLKETQSWSVSGIGKYQLPLTAHAIAMGGHVRVGFEDNIFYKKGEIAESNADFVKRAARISNELDRKVATVSEAKKILGI